MKLYVGCSLFNATQDFRNSIEEFKERLRKEGFEVLQFKVWKNGKPTATAEEIYEWDSNCVKDCDFMIAECTHPSIGLGIEMGMMASLNKPFMAIALKGAAVSLMAQGCAKTSEGFYEYDVIDNIIPIIKKKAKKLQK